MHSQRRDWKVVFYTGGVNRIYFAEAIIAYPELNKMVLENFREMSTDLEGSVEGDNNFLSAEVVEIEPPKQDENYSDEYGGKIIAIHKTYYWTGWVSIYTFEKKHFSWKEILQLISDNYNSRLTTIIIPVLLRGLVDYPGQGGLDGNRSTSEEINGATKQRKNQISSVSESWNG